MDMIPVHCCSTLRLSFTKEADRSAAVFDRGLIPFDDLGSFGGILSQIGARPSF
jgi:hypothetical protein